MSTRRPTTPRPRARPAGPAAKKPRAKAPAAAAAAPAAKKKPARPRKASAPAAAPAPPAAAAPPLPSPDAAGSHLPDSLRIGTRATGAGRFFGMIPPGVDAADLSGHLIVIEGTDGSGRSTQVALLREWLELNGFAVATIGLRRSNLVSGDIDQLVSKNIVTPLTLGLMYAADFYDQLENVILPSMRAGLVVLADRYIYSLIARAVVRGMEASYLEGIYSLALRPDLVFFLNVRPELAFEREFRKAQMVSYWESGRDMNLSNDLFESFIIYQTALRRELGSFAREHEFLEIDAEGPVADVNREMRRRVAALLGIKSLAFRPSASARDLMK